MSLLTDDTRTLERTGFCDPSHCRNSRTADETRPAPGVEVDQQLIEIGSRVRYQLLMAARLWSGQVGKGPADVGRRNWKASCRSISCEPPVPCTVHHSSACSCSESAAGSLHLTLVAIVAIRNLRQRNQCSIRELPREGGRQEKLQYGNPASVASRYALCQMKLGRELTAGCQTTDVESVRYSTYALTVPRSTLVTPVLE